MLKDRIIATLRFFDLQDTALTLLEVHKFLLADHFDLATFIDENFELKPGLTSLPSETASVAEVLQCLEEECRNKVVSKYGYYALYGREGLIGKRLHGYRFGVRRERLIRRFVPFMRYLPFVAGAGLVGSQALGLQKPGSDIDMLVLVNPRFMWLARFFVTLYFQVLGLRRHGTRVANRFCLNHYVALGKCLQFDKNLYTASEYAKMRPLVSPLQVNNFKALNSTWMEYFFPNFVAEFNRFVGVSRIKLVLEKMLDNKFGWFIETQLKAFQYRRLNVGEFIVATDDELSFHPDNRKRELFQRFFEFK